LVVNTNHERGRQLLTDCPVLARSGDDADPGRLRIGRRRLRRFTSATAVDQRYPDKYRLVLLLTFKDTRFERLVTTTLNYVKQQSARIVPVGGR
jgi:hypothetical protein